MNFSFEKLEIPGAMIVNSFVSEDNRGMFIKSFELDIFREAGISFNCNEIFYTQNSRNVVRGMHFQTSKPQGKLVTVICGKVYDVIVDLRKNSPMYGQWQGVYLSANARNCLYIPQGCAHGFLALADDSIVSYACSGKYDKKTDTGILFNDPDINIEWPVGSLSDCIVSSRDRKLMSFREFDQKYSMEL